MSDAIRTRLLERARTLKKTGQEAGGGVSGLEWTARSDAELVNDLERYPHAFVLGCVMDRQIAAERAWAIPGQIRDRLGTFEFRELADLSVASVRDLFQEPSPLHRFPSKMADLFHSALQHIDEEYAGDASRIWSGEVGSAALVRRFLQFEGVGPKIATMAANILVRDFGVELTDHHYIDISVDVHVKRVFQRLGLVPKGASNFEIIYAAREMHTEYPGIFDFPVWEIGREWCHPGKPNCPECLMSDVCPGADRFHPERDRP